MPNIDYGQIIEASLRQNEAWAEPLKKSLLGRIFFANLFAQGLTAVAHARGRGTNLEFYEWSLGDAFELKGPSPRSVKFELQRGSAVVAVSWLYFPASIVSRAEANQEVTAPANLADLNALAQRFVALAVSKLYQ